MVKKKSPYEHKRYWYHVSTTLKKKQVCITPRDEDECMNRDWREPSGKRICVSPTIEQCITAIPYILGATCSIYKTKNRLIAHKPHDVFDSKITQEGWLHRPTFFVKIGTLNFKDIEVGLGVENVIEQAASLDEPRRSGKVLRWWKRARINRFIKKT